MFEKVTGNVDRRGFLRRTGLAAGAAATVPLLGTAPASADPLADPDRLFKAGRFREADLGYQYLLHQDSGNAHAAGRRGYIALLSNRYDQAERHLATAIRLAPGDTSAKRRLADCFVRQNDFARAAPLMREAGQDAFATQYASITGTPYEVHGAECARLPFRGMDPLPLVDVGVNGLENKPFLLDTGAPFVTVSMKVAKEAGLRAVATVQAGIPGQTTTFYLGVADSFRLGGIELCNVPVGWHDLTMPAPPGAAQPAGVFGTGVFHRFLTTMDYAGGALILRRKTRENLRRYQAQARRAGAEVLPLYLPSSPLIPCTMGSVNDRGPKLVSLDTGGAGLGVVTTEETAKQAGIEPDYEHPEWFNGTIKCYPILAEKVSLGKAVNRRVRGVAGPLLFDDAYQFDTFANVTHNFFKPFAITFDYADMDFYVTETQFMAD
ncbi:retropepsin-like aspartic protease [Amycolatopsis nigrescens]|uniref:retropepsin-like aspartic protease n=1 Tax=Amycolatopsis nigrescens TaxID=381445 RepID=UPI00037FB529|nr:retropepsin-like aspartic protease [Amycolatopsis nigrescens]